MKKIFNIVIALTLLVAMSSCDDFLDRPSLTTMDDQNYWSSESTLRLFVQGAYGAYFNGYGRTWSQVYAPGVYSSGEYSDDRTTTNVQSNILLSVPADNWYRAEHTASSSSYADGYWLARRGSNAWNYGFIRKWNLLIARLETMKEGNKLTEEAYNHWMGVARFFRAFEYSRFVQSFGDIPYFDKEITDLSTGEEFAERTPRTTVMNKVLEDFQFAMANVRLDDGQDYVNRDVVATIASRCMLFEGTWYIYHKNDPAMATAENVDANSKKFLEAARDFAEVTINSGKYGFSTDFRKLFGTLFERPNYDELIMYRTYNRTVNSASQHCIASYANGNESQTQSGNLSTLKAWICQDGKPYATSEVENIESWRLQDMVKNRDPRFEATFWDEPKASATGLYCEKFIDREGVTYAYNGESRPTYYGSCTNENGFPVVRYAETVLNWIEAKAELAIHHNGTAVTQDDLDKSINAIRKRPLDQVAIDKGVKQTASLTLDMAKNMNDPERTSDAQKSTLSYKTLGDFVDPLIWEIRRERRMEFFLEQYRVVDIRRWGQLELMLAANNPDLGIGAYVELDLAPTFAKEKDAIEAGFPGVQTTNLKKTLDNTGYNILTIANFKNVSVMPLEGINDDGTLKLGARLFYDGTTDEAKKVILTSNASQMRGFLVPTGFQDRDPRNVELKNYLEPICTQVLSQYEEKGFKLTQNPGWE